MVLTLALTTTQHIDTLALKCAAETVRMGNLEIFGPRKLYKIMADEGETNFDVRGKSISGEMHAHEEVEHH